MILPEGSPLREEAWNRRDSGNRRHTELSVLSYRLETIARMITVVDRDPTTEELDVAGDELRAIAKELR